MLFLDLTPGKQPNLADRVPVVERQLEASGYCVQVRIAVWPLDKRPGDVLIAVGDHLPVDAAVAAQVNGLACVGDSGEADRGVEVAPYAHVFDGEHQRVDLHEWR